MEELDIINYNMKKVLEGQKKYIELFVSINKQVCIEISSKERYIKNTLITGVCCSKLEENLFKYTCVDGINEKSLIDSLKNQCTGIINRKIPQTHDIIAENYECKNLSLEDIYCNIDFYDIDYFYNLKNKYSSSNAILEKVYIQLEQNIYLINDTFGNCGYGIQSFFSPVYEFIEKNYNKKLLIHSIFDNTNDLKKDIKFNYPDKISSKEFNINNMPILLTGNVVGKLLYLLLFFLTSNNIKNNYTFLKTLDSSMFKFSPLLDIEENSDENKIIIGTVDGCCNKRVKKKIIENGEIKAILGYIDDKNIYYDNIESTEFRVNFRKLPVTRAQKVSVGRGKKSVSQIITEYKKILIVNDLIGIENSINPYTTEFTAIVDCNLITEGEIKNYKQQISSSLIKILYNIIEVSADKEYSVDGSIFSPSMLVCHV